LLIVPSGGDIDVVGAVGSAGLPDVGEGGGGGMVCVVRGTVCCAIAPLVNAAQTANMASRIAIGVELLIVTIKPHSGKIPL
jgi:hypothetical protein